MKKFFLGFSLVLVGIVTGKTTVYAGTAPTFTVEYGKSETVFSYSRDRCDDVDVTDFPARALIDASGNLQLYSSHYVSRKFIGNNLTDIKHDCHIMMNSAKNPDPRQYDDFSWITSPYTLDGNTIYALVHTEYHGWEHNNCNSSNQYLNCWWNSINLAKSTDAGYTFTHATPPSQNIANISINYNPNNTYWNLGFFQPSNIIQKDGYYYAKVTVSTNPTNLAAIAHSPYNGPQGTCVMRTNNLNDPGSWKLWDGSGFNVSPRGVPASGKCAAVFAPGADWDWHWNTYLGTYSNLGTKGNQLIVQSSQNLTSLDLPDYTMSQPVTKIAVYHTFLQPGAETRNFEDIGRSPWMYYVTCGDGVSPCTDFSSMNRDLKRVRVRFNKPGDVGKYDVLDLHFNEYKGTKTLDSSFYGNDGGLSGDATFKQDGSTKYLHFGSSYGNVAVANTTSLQLTGNMTFTARLRTSQTPAAGTYPPILVKTDGTKRSYGIFLTPSGQLNFSLMNGTQLAGSLSNKKINDGTWHDVQISFSDSTGTATYIIDGKLDTTVKQGGKLKDGVSTGNITIGGNSFVGDLDHVTLYNYILPGAVGKPGDLNGDGVVNILDYNVLVSKYGNPYTVLDYNTLVANFGK